MRSPESELDDLRRKDLLREIGHLCSPPGREVGSGGKRLLNFASNNYLGLADDPEIKAAAQAATEEFGCGAAASRLIYGGSTAHHHLETRTAEFLQKDAALTFANGYTAAVGVMSSLLGKGDTAILDKRCHASIIDGARLSGATVRVFPHNHLDKLERLLRSHTAHPGDNTRVLIATESVFSMDGDLAPLAEICRLKKKFGALLLLDEAHAFGLLGPGGRGLAHQLGLADDIDLLMTTFGKSAGGAGGCIAAATPWIDLIANRARSFIYSTAPPPAQAAAALAAIDIIDSERGNALRERLRENVDQLAAALDLPPPPAAILPVVFGDERRALDAAATLRDDGLLVPAIRYPTVARGAARLRVTLSAAHTSADISVLASSLRRLLGDGKTAGTATT